MQTKYTLSAFMIIAYAMLSNNVQLQLEKYTSRSVARPFGDFRFVKEVTPLSSWQAPLILCVAYLISVRRLG